MRWNELQNVPAHVKMLSNLLVRHYLQAIGAQALPEEARSPVVAQMTATARP